MLERTNKARLELNWGEGWGRCQRGDMSRDLHNKQSEKLLCATVIQK